MNGKIPIRVLFQSHGLRPGQVARMLGVKRMALWRWIAGERKWPLDQALKVASLLDTPAEQIQFVEEVSPNGS